jgi:hypothetical protein
VLAFAGTLRWLIGPFHLFRLKKMSHFSKTRHPNRFAVRIKIPRRTRSRSLKPKNCLEGRNDKFTAGNVNGTSAAAFPPPCSLIRAARAGRSRTG